MDIYRYLSINILKILLFNIDMDIDIFKIAHINIDILQSGLMDINKNIFKNDLMDIDININIFIKYQCIDNWNVLSIYQSYIRIYQNLLIFRKVWPPRPIFGRNIADFWGHINVCAFKHLFTVKYSLNINENLQYIFLISRWHSHPPPFWNYSEISSFLVSWLPLVSG